MGVVKLVHGCVVVLLRLLVVKLKLLHFSLFFLLLIALPVINTFSLPFLHKTCIALQFVDLDASEVLLPDVLSLLFRFQAVSR